MLLLVVALTGVLIAVLPTTVEILRRGNDADSLRKEIEQENAERDAAASRQKSA